MSPALLRHPRFVSLEGGEGAGKTTAINAIRECLRIRSLTRENAFSEQDLAALGITAESWAAKLRRSRMRVSSLS